jgi:hypothetical protein
LQTPGIIDGSTRNLSNDLLPLQGVVLLLLLWLLGVVCAEEDRFKSVGLVENFSVGGARFERRNGYSEMI